MEHQTIDYGISTFIAEQNRVDQDPFGGKWNHLLIELSNVVAAKSIRLPFPSPDDRVSSTLRIHQLPKVHVDGSVMNVESDGVVQ